MMDKTLDEKKLFLELKKNNKAPKSEAPIARHVAVPRPV